MPQVIEFDGQLHEFPDDFTSDEISTALSSLAAPKPQTSPNTETENPTPPALNPADEFSAPEKPPEGLTEHRIVETPETPKANDAGVAGSIGLAWKGLGEGLANSIVATEKGYHDLMGRQMTDREAAHKIRTGADAMEQLYSSPHTAAVAPWIYNDPTWRLGVQRARARAAQLEKEAGSDEGKKKEADIEQSIQEHRAESKRLSQVAGEIPAAIGLTPEEQQHKATKIGRGVATAAKFTAASALPGGLLAVTAQQALESSADARMHTERELDARGIYDADERNRILNDAGDREAAFVIATTPVWMTVGRIVPGFSAARTPASAGPLRVLTTGLLAGTAGNEATARAINAVRASLDAPNGERAKAAWDAAKHEDFEGFIVNTLFAATHSIPEAANRSAQHEWANSVLNGTNPQMQQLGEIYAHPRATQTEQSWALDRMDSMQKEARTALGSKEPAPPTPAQQHAQAIVGAQSAREIDLALAKEMDAAGLSESAAAKTAEANAAHEAIVVAANEKLASETEKTEGGEQDNGLQKADEEKVPQGRKEEVLTREEPSTHVLRELSNEDGSPAVVGKLSDDDLRAALDIAEHPEDRVAIETEIQRRTASGKSSAPAVEREASGAQPAETAVGERPQAQQPPAAPEPSQRTSTESPSELQTKGATPETVGKSVAPESAKTPAEASAEVDLFGEPTRAPQAGNALDPSKHPIVEFPVEKLKLSEDVPNFKGGASAITGVVEGQELEGKYERLGTPPIVAWERANGDTEVITGRHRLDLARRTGEKTIPTQVVRESDGFTKAMAMTFDAEANIRDGQGEVSDYATYFKGTDITEAEARERGLLARAKGKAGWHLAKNASDDVYSLWRSGKLDEAKAVAIAETAPGNADAQRIGTRAALDGEKPAVIRNAMIDAMARAKDLSKSEQTDMFATTAWDEENKARAKFATAQQESLRERIRAIKGAAKNPEVAREEGIDIHDEAALRRRLDELADDLARWMKWGDHADLRAEVDAETGKNQEMKPELPTKVADLQPGKKTTATEAESPPVAAEDRLQEQLDAIPDDTLVRVTMKDGRVIEGPMKRAGGNEFVQQGGETVVLSKISPEREQVANIESLKPAGEVLAEKELRKYGEQAYEQPTTRDEYERTLYDLARQEFEARTADDPEHKSTLRAMQIDAQFNRVADEIELAKSKRKYIKHSFPAYFRGEPLKRKFDMGFGPLDVLEIGVPKPTDFDPNPAVRKARHPRPANDYETKQEIENSLKAARQDMRTKGGKLAAPAKREKLQRIIDKRVKQLERGEYYEAVLEREQAGQKIPGEGVTEDEYFGTITRVAADKPSELRPQDVDRVMSSVEAEDIEGYRNWLLSREGLSDETRAEVEKWQPEPAAKEENLPTLRSGENQGDLLSKQTEDLTLVGEQGRDTVAEAEAKAKAERDAAEAKRIQDEQQGDLFKSYTPKRASILEDVPAGNHERVSEVVGKLANGTQGVDVEVLRNESELPEEVRSQLPRLAIHEGLTNTKTGKVWIFSDHVSPERAPEVFAHEVIGHYGVGKVLPKSEWNSVARLVISNHRAEAEKIAADYLGGKALDALDENQRSLLAREFVARLAENPKLAPTLWARIMAGVRKFLRSIGIRREWSDAELQDLIRRGARAVERGEGTESGEGLEAALRKLTPEEIAAREREAGNTPPAEPPLPPTSEAPSAEPGGEPGGIKNALTVAGREQRGFGPRMAPLRKKWGVAWDEAMSRIAADPAAGRKLVDEVRAEPRPLTDTENALLAYETTVRENVFDEAVERVNRLPDGALKIDAVAKLQRAAEDNQAAYEADELAGSEQGRGLASRKMRVNRDLTLARMVAETRAVVNDGKPLTEDQMAEVQKLHTELASARTRIEELERQAEDTQINSYFSKLLEDSQRSLREAAKSGKSFVDFAREQREKARARIRARGARLAAGLDPAELLDYAVIGMSYIAEGVGRGAEFATAMVRDFGDTIRPHLDEIFNRAQQMHDAEKAAYEKRRVKAAAPTKKKPTVETILNEVKAGAEAGQELSQKMVFDLVRAHVEEGMTQLDEVIRAVHQDLIGTYPDITEREVRDAFSGYGKVRFPSKDEVLTKVRELRRLGQLQSAIEDAQKRLAPLKSGPQRDELTQAIRDKQKELQRIMRENGIESVDPARQLKNTLAAIKTRLRNEIEDITRWIDQGGRTAAEKEPRKGVEYDEEANVLRAHRDELRKTLDEIEGTGGITDEQRIAIANRSLDRVREELDRRIQSGEFIKPKADKDQISTPELERKRAEIQSMRDYIQEQADAINPPKSDVERGVEAAEKARDYYDSLLTGETEAKPRAERVPLSQREEDIRSEVESMKAALREMRAAQRKGDPNEAARKRELRSLERSIAEYERRARERDFAPKGKTQGPPTAEIARARAARDAAKAAYEALKKAATARSPEEIQLARDKKLIAKRIEELERRMRVGDFEPKPKKAAVMDEEKSRALFDYQQAKQRYTRMQFEALQKKRTIGRKVIDGFAEALNTSRAVMTAVDLSAALRQGGFIALSHPIRALKSFPAMFRAFGSEKGAFDVNEEIRNRPNAALYNHAKLFIADETATSLTKMEELFMSRLAHKIPVVSGSARAYTAFLNKLRADSFDAMVDTLSRNGTPTLDEARQVANYINVVTGRGDLGGAAQAAVGLNTVFFAPRYVVSRFQTLTLQPIRKGLVSGKGTGRVRLEIAKEYGRYLAGVGVVLSLGILAGGSVEDDPTSADFGKLRFGNTRLDMLSGLLQATVFSAREIKQLAKTLTGGRRKFNEKTGGDILFRFLRTKLAPAPGAIVDLLTGTDLAGNEATLMKTSDEFPWVTGEIPRLFVPLTIGDIYQAMQDQGVAEGAAFSLLSLFGASVQSYEQRRKYKP